MLYIHTSNRLEQLKNQYAAVTKTPLNDVLAVETVVVQNAGMARWLSMEMSQLSGISANTEFLFPAEFMWGLLRLVSPDIPEHSQCAPDTLRFHIYNELTQNAKLYPELHHYITDANTSSALQDDDDTNKPSDNFIDEQIIINHQSIWELSCQVATLLDQYLFYRSEWIIDWENDSTINTTQANNVTEQWQARLWNKCVKDKGLIHWLALQHQFTQNIENVDTSLFAERISFFSMSALSPGYIDLLGGIAEKTDIHIFIINPCEDIYWGDIRSPKSHAKLSTEQQSYTDIGNPLLASLGKQGQDFIDKLLAMPHEDTSTLWNEEEQTEELTLLQQIQYDIYSLTAPVPKTNHQKEDKSLLFNACHTAMREVEVLHDQLLDQLNSDDDLLPSDIVVMMPDIEKYAPYIESVFGSSIMPSSDTDLSIGSKPKKATKLPFSIADRDPQNIFKITQALSKLLTLPDSRFEVEAVFELLEYDELRTHFGLDQEQLNYCRELALATNIRWGISDKTRKQKNLPNTEEHTWKYALDSMLLGYSLPSSSFETSASTSNSYPADEQTETEEKTSNPSPLFTSNRNLPLLPYNEIEGHNALVLAKFKTFTDTIFSINEWESESLTLEQWIKKTSRLIQKLTPESPDQQRIFKTLADLQLKAKLAEFDQTLPYAVYQTMLKGCLSDISANEKYLGYGITFCALVPMRSVPFKIVALMGMNDGEFPRQDTRPSFDLMANKSRKGDRSRRDEDRYLFLESILAARSTLIISYIGQSVKDNTDMAPSIVVSELLDTLTIMSQKNAEDWIIKHPLQAFSARYFIHGVDSDNYDNANSNDNDNDNDNKQRLFSYASQYLRLNQNQQMDDVSKDEGFISNALTPLADDSKTLSLNDLITFFKNPSKVFLQQRFNIQTYDRETELQNREPFAIESFKDRDIRQLLFDASPSLAQNADELNKDEFGDDTNTQYTEQLIARAKGLLPYGQIGDEIFKKEAHTINEFKTSIPEAEPLANKQITLNLGEFTLIAQIDQLTTIGRYVKQLGEPYTGDYISLWLTHLCLNASHTDINKHTIFYSPEKRFEFPPIDNAAQQLTTLLEYYWLGLHQALPFFPKSSFAFLKNPSKENTNAMSDKWNGDDRYPGEKSSFEHRLLHKNIILNKDEQPDDILQISRDVFGTMFSVLSERE